MTTENKIVNAPCHWTVGWRFRGPDSGIYLCTKWLRRTGFIMRLVAFDEPGMIETDITKRKIGAVTDISERAIDRTFHHLRESHPAYMAEPEPHEAECNCWICEKRPRG